MSTEEKRVWNLAIEAAYREVLKFDGIIPNYEVRQYMATSIKHKLSYKHIKTKLQP